MKPFLYVSEVVVFMGFYMLLSLILPVYTTQVSGVDEGDWASYNVISAWHSTIPGDTVPQDIMDVNQTEWRLDVNEVLGDEESVRVCVTMNYANETKREIHTGNLRTGSGNLSMWVVRKGLNMGDLVHIEKELQVNSTESLEFAGAVRQAVYAWFRQEEADGSVWKHDLFWDRETGVLCGEVISSVHTVDTYICTMAIRISIVETSLWEPSGDGFWLLVWGVIILVVVLAIGVLVWKGGKSSRRKTRGRSS